MASGKPSGWASLDQTWKRGFRLRWTPVGSSRSNSYGPVAGNGVALRAIGVLAGRMNAHGWARLYRKYGSGALRWNVTVPAPSSATMPSARLHEAFDDAGVGEEAGTEAVSPGAPTFPGVAQALVAPITPANAFSCVVDEATNDRAAVRRTSLARSAWPSEYVTPDRSWNR